MTNAQAGMIASAVIVAGGVVGHGAASACPGPMTGLAHSGQAIGAAVMVMGAIAGGVSLLVMLLTRRAASKDEA